MKQFGRSVWDRPRVLEAALTFLANALLPRLSHRLRWRTRLGPRGLTAYAVAWTVFAVAFIWAVTRIARMHEDARAELRARLGCEPTPDELFEHFQAEEES